MTTRLELERLRNAHFGPIDLMLEPGECLAVSGPSGAGKSCFLRAIADLDPSQGEVRLDGRSRNEFRPPTWRRQVALLPSECQWWNERVREHFDDPGALAVDVLALSPEILERSVARLSSGEGQRLALLRLLANQPAVLLLDEPTVNLDEANIGKVEAVIEHYRQEHGAAVVWVSHSRAQRERVATRELCFPVAGRRR